MNRLTYTGLDYDTIQDELLARLQVQFAEEFNDFAVSSLAIVLLDLESYGLDGLAFYLDKRASEVYLSIAETRQAVARGARQLGYKMRSAFSAAWDLYIAVPDTLAFAVPIPAGFLFRGPGGLVFEVARPVTFLAGETGGAVTKIVPVFEGQTQQETFVSDGTPNQSFDLRRANDGKYVVSGTVTVRVNGTTWSESEMLTVEATNQYEVAYNDEPPSLKFGDGTAGNIPPTGASIVCTYRASSGARGRAAKDTIQGPISPLVVNNQTVTLTVSSPSGTSGGDDPESLDEARRNAPLAWKSRQVAVTRGDYEALAVSFSDPLAGRVAVAQAFSARSAQNDLVLQSQLRRIRGATTAPVTPTATALATLQGRLDSMREELTGIASELAGIASDTASLAADLDALTTAVRAVEASASGLVTTAASVSGAAAATKATLSGFSIVGGLGTEQLRQSTLDTLNARLDTILAAASTVTAAGGSIGGQAASLLGTLTTARVSVASVGTDLVTDGTRLNTLAAAQTALVSVVGTPTPTTASYADCAAISAAVVESATASYAVVEGACVEVYNHVDQILASDCKANLVVVPILSKDAGGFYVAPSISLVQALQVFLDARKEVTQTVAVVSGDEYLIPASVVARVGIQSGYSLSLLQTGALAAIEGLLRGRRFGEGLYVSDLVRAISALDGVAFVNVTILGHLDGSSLLTDKLDGSGNLVLSSSELVTKGAVAVSVEYLASSRSP